MTKQAFRRTLLRRIRVLTLTALAVSATTLVASGTASAGVKPQTINLLEIDTSFVGTGGFNFKGNRPPAVGQGIAFEGKLYKFTGGKQGALYGTLHTACTFTSETGASVCTGVASLPGGKIVVSGRTPANSSKAFVIPIVGGSGAYTGAKGYVRIKPIGGERSSKSANTIVITG